MGDPFIKYDVNTSSSSNTCISIDDDSNNSRSSDDSYSASSCSLDCNSIDSSESVSEDKGVFHYDLDLIRVYSTRNNRYSSSAYIYPEIFFDRSPFCVPSIDNVITYFHCPSGSGRKKYWNVAFSSEKAYPIGKLCYHKGERVPIKVYYYMSLHVIIIPKFVPNGIISWDFLLEIFYNGVNLVNNQDPDSRPLRIWIFSLSAVRQWVDVHNVDTSSIEGKVFWRINKFVFLKGSKQPDGSKKLYFSQEQNRRLMPIGKPQVFFQKGSGYATSSMNNSSIRQTDVQKSVVAQPSSLIHYDNIYFIKKPGCIQPKQPAKVVSSIGISKSQSISISDWYKDLIRKPWKTSIRGNSK